jgi:hypothetical protein
MAQQWQDFPTGTRVQVRNRFNQHWTSGFEVADVDHDAYRLRRLSDNHVLPVAFDEDEVRAEG